MYDRLYLTRIYEMRVCQIHGHVTLPYLPLPFLPSLLHSPRRKPPLHTHFPRTPRIFNCTYLIPFPPSTPANTKLNHRIRPLDPPPRRADPTHPPLLIPPQPRLLRLAQDLLSHKIHDQSDHDHDKGNGIQEIDGQAKNLDADDDAPEIAGEEGDVEESGGGETEHERGEGVEEGEGEGVADEVAGHVTIPGRGAERVAVEDGGLDAVDDHAPEAHLADDFVEGTFGDEEFLGDVGEAVEGGAEEGEEVAFELVGAADDAGVGGVGDVVGGEQEAHAADADEDAGHLAEVVADAQGEEGDQHDDDDGPEVEELGAEDGGVAVGEHGEVVAFDVHEGEDEV